MKTIIMALMLVIAGTASFAQVKKSKVRYNHHNTAAKRYFCTMHPEVVRKKPGNYPKCGMALMAGRNFR